MKTVLIIPHGAKFNGPDPLMTGEGVEQIQSLKSYLVANAPQVWRGEGRRHGQVADVIDLVPTHYSALWGPASSVERRADGPVTVLPDGMEFPFKPADATIFKASLLTLIHNEVADGAIICAGRECLMALTGKGTKELQTGIHQITVDGETVTHQIVALAPGDF